MRGTSVCLSDTIRLTHTIESIVNTKVEFYCCTIISTERLATFESHVCSSLRLEFKISLLWV